MAQPQYRQGLAPVDMPVSFTYSGGQGFRYRACRPDEILIKSGMGIRDEFIGKKTFQWPFQRVTVITLAPRNYNFTLHCISRDMVPFELPVVFTCGPYDPKVDPDGFHRYASKMSAMTAQQLQEVILGIIHGQTRLYAAGLTVLEMFNDRDSFKMHVQERIGKELISFGLCVFNGNVAEMRDSEGNTYFSSLKQKAISGAVNDARIQTAEAVKMGDIGENERQADTRIRLAEISNQSRIMTAEAKKLGDVGENEREAEAKIRLAEINAKRTEAENIRQQQIVKSKLELELVNIACKKDQETSRVMADMAPRKKHAELQAELNRLEGFQQTEFLRSTNMSKTVIEAEQTIKQAEAEAESMKKRADAQLYADQKKAEGIIAITQAQGEGLRNLLEGTDPDIVKYHLAIEHNLFEKLADKTAQAIQGLAPKLNIWTTGAGGSSPGTGGPTEAFGPLHSLFTSIPPMLSAVQSQTDVKMPSWMPNCNK